MLLKNYYKWRWFTPLNGNNLPVLRVNDWKEKINKSFRVSTDKKHVSYMQFFKPSTSVIIRGNDPVCLRNPFRIFFSGVEKLYFAMLKYHTVNLNFNEIFKYAYYTVFNTDFKSLTVLKL